MLRRELHGQALRALGAEMTDGAADELLAEAAAPISWLQRQRCDLAGIRCGKLRGYMPDDRIVQEGVEAAGCGLAVPHIKITAVSGLAPPFLAFERRDVRREVRGVIQKIDAERTVLHGQTGDGGIIAIWYILAAEQPLLERAEHGTMCKNGDRFPRVRGGNVAQRRLKTRGKLWPRLTALDVPVDGVVVELFKQLRFELLQLAEGVVLPAAEADLAQARVGVQRKILWRINGRGGLAGAIEIAGITGVNLDWFKAAAERLDLKQAVRRNQRIVPAVDAAIGVSLGLGVADEIKRGHGSSL